MGEVSTRELLAAGFQERERAQRFLEDPHLRGLDAGALVRTFRDAANPDDALLLLIRLAERDSGVLDLFTSPDQQSYPHAVPLIRLLGASHALGEFLIRHPENTDLLRENYPPEPPSAEPEQVRTAFLEAVRADPGAATPVATLDEDFTAAQAAVAMRIAYRRHLTRLALRDLCAVDPLDYQPSVSRQLADAAGSALEAALAVARAEVQSRLPEAADVTVAVIGMGKTGARELNYISDVDVIYVHEAAEDMEDAHARHVAVTLVSTMAKLIQRSDGEPGLWEVDANLRPEGKDGPLSRTVASHQEYYRRWASGWEFQALLKARPIAGDRQLGQAYMDTIWPLVWQSSSREGFVEDVQAMRRRVFEHIPRRDVDRELKLGRGGLRDIEFTVQLLQLVHGRVDESLHVQDTLSAVAALAAGEYISTADEAAMSRCYRTLRLLEHRIQLRQMRRTHLMPEKPEHLRCLGRAMNTPGDTRRMGPDEVIAWWRDTVREVSTFHQQIFYRPLLSTTAVLADDEVRLSQEAVQARLSALGYQDATGALRHIQAMTAGVSRKSTLQRRIMPAMLGWLAEGVDPDHGLLAFRRISEALGNSPWYLTMLRDSSMAAERLSQLLTSSKMISEMLEHRPESTQWLGEDAALAPRSFDQLWTEVQNAILRHEGSGITAARLARLVRQREMLRTAIAEACGLLDVQGTGRALSEADRVAILGALRVAENELFVEQGQPRLVQFLVVAMGRQGGREISYGSDMDAMFVHRSLEGSDPAEADAQAQKLALRLTQLLSKPVKPAVRGEFALQIDADLRPEGKKGPLSRSLESFREYYQRWMQTWERQALLRARPIAGSDALAADTVELINQVRYGQAPDSAALREIRRIKARMESERLPRGADPARHVKLGRGGLSDIEWVVQLLQMQHAHEYPVLRGTGTLQVMNALVDCQLMSPDDARILADAWVLCTQVRNAVVVWGGRNADVLPSSRRDLEAVSRWCGFGSGHATAFEERYLRATRHSRQVFERLFFES